MSTAFECSICTEIYNVADHKPICLPCGHTFCLACVRCLDVAKSRSCYSCCKPVNQKTEQLPVVYALIGLDKNRTTVRCKVHIHELEYWCVPCQVSLCKKCVKVQHGEHRVEFMEDLMDNEACAADANAEIYCQLKAKQDRLSSAISVREEIIATFEGAKEVIAKISKEKDRLIADKKSHDRDIDTWEGDSKSPSTQEGKRQLFREIMHRSQKVKIIKEEEILELEEKLAQLKKALAFLSSNDGEQHFVGLPDDETKRFIQKQKIKKGQFHVQLPENLLAAIANFFIPARSAEPRFLSYDHWKVTNNVKAQRAVADVRAGLTPAQVTVKSTLASPVLRLRAVLISLGRACVGEMHVQLLDTFWSELLREENLQTFIKEFGHKVDVFYGSVENALAISRVRGQTSTSLGVRLNSMRDVYECEAYCKTISSVCCIRSLPARAGRRMTQLSWQPQYWHFPDVRDYDIDWLHTLLVPFPNSFDRHLYLPGCRLTEEGFLRLLTFSHFNTIYCDPQGSLQLSDDAQHRLSVLAVNKKIILHWVTPLDEIF